MTAKSPAPDDLLRLSELSQKDRIQILLSEYAALRAEIVSRTGYGFLTANVAAGVIIWFMTQLMTPQQLYNRPLWFWAIIVLVTAFVATCFCISFFVNSRDLKRASKRIKELEHEVNSRAGEHLLVWETLSGVLTRMGLTRSYFSAVKPFPRSELSPLDPSYLQRDTELQNPPETPVSPLMPS